jgi:hypothetical protein
MSQETPRWNNAMFLTKNRPPRHKDMKQISLLREKKGKKKETPGIGETGDC